jgi:hypothetical protein
VAETTTTLVTNEDFNAFEVALDRQTWPDGGRVVPITSRQMAAVRTALEAAAVEMRARWVAEALEEIARAVPPGGVAGETSIYGLAHGDLRRIAAEYRAGTR